MGGNTRRTRIIPGEDFDFLLLGAREREEASEAGGGGSLSFANIKGVLIRERGGEGTGARAVSVNSHQAFDRLRRSIQK